MSDNSSGRNGRNVVRVAALGDIHGREALRPALQSLFEQTVKAADVLVLCGDLTDHGLPDEARAVAQALTAAGKIRPSRCWGTTTTRPAAPTKSARSSPRPASCCSTATPSRCAASASPG